MDSGSCLEWELVGQGREEILGDWGGEGINTAQDIEDLRGWKALLTSPLCSFIPQSALAASYLLLCT